MASYVGHHEDAPLQQTGSVHVSGEFPKVTRQDSPLAWFAPLVGQAMLRSRGRRQLDPVTVWAARDDLRYSGHEGIRQMAMVMAADPYDTRQSPLIHPFPHAGRADRQGGNASDVQQQRRAASILDPRPRPTSPSHRRPGRSLDTGLPVRLGLLFKRPQPAHRPPDPRLPPGPGPRGPHLQLRVLSTARPCSPPPPPFRLVPLALGTAVAAVTR
jgi:hypothetical protein